MRTNDPLRVASSTRLLNAIDRGDYRTAIEHINAEPVSDTLDDAMVRAECALYLDRLEEADELVAELPSDVRRLLNDSGDLGQIARRAKLIEAGLEYARGRFDGALEISEPIMIAARLVGDGFSELRAAYDSGRSARRLGREFDAKIRLATALRLS